MVVNCPKCGTEVAVPDPSTVATVSVACTACESRLEVAVALDGAETLLQARLHPEWTDRPPAAQDRDDPSATMPLGSGTSILATDSPTSPGRSVETVLRGSLVVLGTDQDAVRFELGSNVTTVGRGAADIVITDDAISSCHCEIEARGGEFFIRDLDSSNGTFVNDERVSAAQLASGDTIRIGQTVLAFKLVEAIAVEPKDQEPGIL